MSCSVFDQSAGAFAAATDSQIAENAYRRGDLFVGAARKWVVGRGEVLDYGCGPGRISRLVAQLGYRTLGVDPSAEMIRCATEQPGIGSQLSFAPLSDECLKPSAYDGILCSSVIEYVPHPEYLLAKFRQALRPDGKLIFSYANRLSIWRAYAKWRFADSPHFKLQCNVWSLAECAGVLRQAGLKIIDGPHFFDSPLDGVDSLSAVRGLKLIGTLGLIVAEPINGQSH